VDNIVCTNATVGTWTDGIYRATDSPAVYKLKGQRACLLTWDQFVALGQPAQRLLTPAEGARFTQAFFKSGDVCSNADAGVR
jgi:hypothetical protein